MIFDKRHLTVCEEAFSDPDYRISDKYHVNKDRLPI